MQRKLIIILSALSLNLIAANFPSQPDSKLTPGSLCTHPTTYRYKEHIPYCDRDVDTQLKRDIIQTYDREFNYHIGQMNRQDFKIDHYIPLCMGGSNNENNLWPQHKSIYEQTDPFEPELCGRMASGRLTQKEAMSIITYVKAHPENGAALFKKLTSSKSAADFLKANN